MMMMRLPQSNKKCVDSPDSELDSISSPKSIHHDNEMWWLSVVTSCVDSGHWSTLNWLVDRPFHLLVV